MHRIELWKDGFSDEKDTGITQADKLEFKLDIQFHKDDASTEPFEGYEDTKHLQCRLGKCRIKMCQWQVLC
ncbi:hypothetical protein LLG07_03740 [bacterium]|nr:hypothetical protein [bacterium]